MSHCFRMNVVGDLVLTKKFEEISFSEDLLSNFKDSDYNIVNLESPITEAGEKEKIIKTGPHLKGNKESTEDLLDKIGINLCALANNHILDYGQQGLKDTIKFCLERNREISGAGFDLQTTHKVVRILADKTKISIINFTENEWSSATFTNGGAFGFNLIDIINLIKQEKAEGNLILIIPHGGHEMFDLPSPRIRKLYRFLIENGADAIIGHHPHVISGKEIYMGKPIYYSVGNFIFTANNKPKQWYEGMGVSLFIKDQKFYFEEFFFNVLIENSTIKISDFPDLKVRFEELSKIIIDDAKLNFHWQNHIDRMSASFIQNLSINFYLPSVINKILNKIGIKLYNKKVLSLILNLLRCESHQDLTQEILLKKISNN